MKVPLPMSENFKVLILFAHPNRDRSRVQSRLLSAVMELPDVTVVDLYNEYPDFLINVRREQARVEKHQLIIFQHPLYWYSCPALLKEWMDCVLEQGWAYGEGGNRLNGLDFLQVISTGGHDEAYARTGNDRFTIAELLRPFEATAHLCGWRYHKPLIAQGVQSFDTAKLEEAAERYRQLIDHYRIHGRVILDALDTSGDSEEGMDA